MDRRRIATVIPLYNGSKYIRQAIGSVLQQTRPTDRIVVVNDGSSDDGPEIVSSEFPKHLVQIIDLDNGGQSRARNVGVQAAPDCDLVAFLDQDDAWYPEHLDVLEKAFHSHSTQRLAYAYSNLDQIDRVGRRIHQSLLDLIAGPRQKTKIHELIGSDLFVLPSASLVDRSAFLSVGGFDERLSGYEDDDLFLRLFLAGFDHAYVATPLSQWRIYSESCSSSPRMRKSRLTYAMKLMEMFPKDEAACLDYPKHVIWPRFQRTLRFEMKRAIYVHDHTSFGDLAEDFIKIAKAAGSYDLTSRLTLKRYRLKAMLRAA